MEQPLLEEIIKDWWRQMLPQIKSRDIDLGEFYFEKLKKVITIVGFRRVGKTFLLLDFASKIGKENCIYINFEDERIPEKTEVLTSLLEVVKELRGGKKTILLLDEIQNIPKWSKWVRRVNDAGNYFLFLSGSSSKLSSSEIPTELRGRTISLGLYPLSFKELFQFKQQDAKTLPKTEILRTLRGYLEFGGFPEIVIAEEGKKYFFIDEYFKTFLVRDIFERYNLRQKEALKALIKILLNSTYFTISKLANTLKSLDYKIGKGTVSQYLGWLEDSFFVYFLKIYSPSIKNQLQCPKKAYFIDNFFLTRFSTKFSENRGRLMENLVAQNLLRKLTLNPLSEVYYWKDYQQNEIDFVVREGAKTKELIQVTYASAFHEIEEREISSLVKGSKELKSKNLTIITWDFENEKKIKERKIKFVPLWKWLLD